MADPNARDLKLIQYLNEAYGTEKRLETALEAHVAMTTRDAYRKRLQQHLRETKRHAKDVERRIKKLGGSAETIELPGPDAATGAAQALQTVANKAVAAAQGPLHAVRGTSEPEKMLRNARTEFQSEAEEIAHYTAIEALAAAVGDKETAKLAKIHRREEERMASFLERLIPQLTKSVATAEIPASQRDGGGRRRRSTSRRSTGGSRGGASASRSSTSSRSASSGRAKSSRATRSTRAKSTRAKSTRAKSTRAKSTRAKSTRAKSTRAKSSRASGSSSRSAASRSGTASKARSGSASKARSGGSRAGGSRSRSGSGSRARSGSRRAS